MLVVPEILGHRQRGVAHAETAARRLVHLAEDHHHVRQHAGFLHLAVKLLAFATTFADAAKNAYALLVPDHVVDHFGEQHRLAHARPAEQARFAAALQRHEHIDDLDPRLEDLGFGGTPCQRRRGSMDGAPLDICRRRLAVDGVAEHVEHSRENSLADRRLQRPARVLHRHAAGEALGGGQRDSTHAMRVELSQNLDGNLALLRVQQRVDGRQMCIEPYIHDTAAHRDDHAEIRRTGFVAHAIFPLVSHFFRAARRCPRIGSPFRGNDRFARHPQLPNAPGTQAETDGQHRGDCGIIAEQILHRRGRRPVDAEQQNHGDGHIPNQFAVFRVFFVLPV